MNVPQRHWESKWAPSARARAPPRAQDLMPRHRVKGSVAETTFDDDA